MGIQAVMSHKGTKAHEKEEKKKVEIERFFKKHVKCTKTVNETNNEYAEVLSSVKWSVLAHLKSQPRGQNFQAQI